MFLEVKQKSSSPTFWWAIELSEEKKRFFRAFRDNVNILASFQSCSQSMTSQGVLQPKISL